MKKEFKKWAKNFVINSKGKKLSEKHAFNEESKYEHFYITGEDLFEAFKAGHNLSNQGKYSYWLGVNNLEDKVPTGNVCFAYYEDNKCVIRVGPQLYDEDVVFESIEELKGVEKFLHGANKKTLKR